jgi:quercetin dioxygenase-like cupin family protein
MDTLMQAKILKPEDSRLVSVGGGLSVRFMIGGDETDRAYALVEHPLAPGFLAAPLHTHQHEDQYALVLEGEVGMQIGEETIVAMPGTLVFKPRGIPHTFWNPGTEPARLLEIISPAGFEKFFEEVGQYFPDDGPEDIPGFLALCERYDLAMDLDSVPELHQKHNLQGM